MAGAKQEEAIVQDEEESSILKYDTFSSFERELLPRSNKGLASGELIRMRKESPSNKRWSGSFANQ